MIFDLYFCFMEYLPFLFTPRMAKRDISYRDTYVVLMIVGVLVVLLIVKKLFDVQEKKEHDTFFWKNLKGNLLSKGIDENRAEDFMALLRNMKLRHPYKAINSIDKYDRMVYGKLIKERGQAFADEIRSKLFFYRPKPIAATKKEESDDELLEQIFEDAFSVEEEYSGKPVAEDPLVSVDEHKAKGEGVKNTADLQPGAEIKIHFNNEQGMFNCGIIAIEDDAFMIFLPSRSGNTIIPVEGDPIEGYLPLNDTYYYFESVISKVFTGDVMCCSITHAMFIHELQRRAYTRLPMNYPFRFCHVPSNRNLDVSAADTGIWRKEGKLWQGVLADISAGGCAVNLEDPKLHIEVGDLLMFPVALPGMEPIKVAGRIIGWDTKIDESTGKEEKKMCHVRFIGLDDLIKDRIIKAIFAMMKKHHDSKG